MSTLTDFPFTYGTLELYSILYKYYADSGGKNTQLYSDSHSW